METLEDLLSRRVIFHCKRRGGRDGKKDFEVVHSFSNHLSQELMPKWSTPSLKLIYERWNGFRLFQPNEEVDDGFRFFSLDEAKDELLELKEVFAENLEWYEEETEFEDLEAWLDGLIPIAEIMCSGDKFALDTYHRNDEGECPIIFLDHEGYYGGCCDPESMDKVAENPISLVEKILKDPLKYISSHWTGGNFNEQWYPESTSIA